MLAYPGGVTSTRPAPRSTAPARESTGISPWGALGLASLLTTAVLTLVVALALGGGADAPLVADPGPVVRYGLPVAKLVLTLAAAATIGGLLLALIALAPGAPSITARSTSPLARQGSGPSPPPSRDSSPSSASSSSRSRSTSASADCSRPSSARPT